MGKKDAIVLYGELMQRLSPANMLKIVQADNYEIRFTGAEANVGVCCVNFGMDAYVVSMVPEHDVGQACLNYLRRYGLDTTYVARGGERLGILYTETGHSQRPSKVIYDRKYSAFNQISKGLFNWGEILQDKKWLHFCGTAVAQDEGPAQELLRGLKMAKEAGVVVSCDYNYRKKLWGERSAKEIMEEFMQYVDVGIGNEEDCEAMFGIHAEGTDFERGLVDGNSYSIVAEKMVKKYNLKLQAITLRESISANRNGWSAVLHDGNKCYHSTKYMIDILDRIGGGDSFSGSLIYSIISGENYQKALDFAVASSCLKQTIAGDFNLASKDDVLHLVNNNSGGRVQR